MTYAGVVTDDKVVLPGTCHCGRHVVLIRGSYWQHGLHWVNPLTYRPCRHA